MALLSELRRTDKPLWTGATAVYPWSEALAGKYQFTSKFGDEVPLFRREGNFIHLPRALCPVGNDDRRDGGEHVVFPKSPEPREHQKLLFAKLDTFIKLGQSGVISAFTGFGKTILGYRAAYMAQRKTLVITTKDDIYKQWLDGAEKFLGLEPEETGEIRGDKCQVLNTKFVVAMIQSLSKDGKYPDWISKGFGLVIFDEVHRLCADQFSRAAGMFPAKIRLGLSATPCRADGKEPLVFAHIGPIMAQTEAEEQVPKVLRFRSKWDCPRVYRTDPATHERELIRLPHEPGKTVHVEKAIAADPVRNLGIANLIALLHSKGRKAVVFSTLHDHLRAMHRLCGKEFKISGRDMGFYLAATTKKEKEHREREKVKPILFTTYNMMGEGTSLDWLDTAILAMPRANVTQPVGRIRREYPDKNEPIVMDIIDLDSPIFSNYSSARLKWYRKLGALVKDYEL